MLHGFDSKRGGGDDIDNNRKLVKGGVGEGRGEAVLKGLEEENSNEN